jgi:hypothetical protein
MLNLIAKIKCLEPEVDNSFLSPAEDKMSLSLSPLPLRSSSYGTLHEGKLYIIQNLWV